MKVKSFCVELKEGLPAALNKLDEEVEKLSPTIIHLTDTYYPPEVDGKNPYIVRVIIYQGSS